MTRQQFRILAALTVVAGFLGGAASNLLLSGTMALAQPEDAVQDVVSAKEFRLVDDEGNKRAEWRLVAGDPVLVFAGAAGASRAGLGLRDGEPVMLLADAVGRPRVVLSLTDGEPRLVLHDKAGAGRAGLGLEGGEPALLLADTAGKARAVLSLMDDEPKLALFDEQQHVTWSTP